LVGHGSNSQILGEPISATGTTGSTGAYVTITPAAGRTFYLMGAQVGVKPSVTSTTTENATVELRNEAAVIDLLGQGFGGTTSWNGSQQVSKVQGILIGDGVKTITLNCTINTGATVVGSIWGYLI